MEGTCIRRAVRRKCVQLLVDYALTGRGRGLVNQCHHAREDGSREAGAARNRQVRAVGIAKSVRATAADTYRRVAGAVQVTGVVRGRSQRDVWNQTEGA